MKPQLRFLSCLTPLLFAIAAQAWPGFHGAENQVRDTCEVGDTPYQVIVYEISVAVPILVNTYCTTSTILSIAPGCSFTVTEAPTSISTVLTAITTAYSTVTRYRHYP